MNISQYLMQSISKSLKSFSSPLDNVAHLHVHLVLVWKYMNINISIRKRHNL